MNAIGIYVEHVNRKKSEIEEEMYYLLEQNLELERVIREAKEAEKKLQTNRKKMMELVVQFQAVSLLHYGLKEDV